MAGPAGVDSRGQRLALAATLLNVALLVALGIAYSLSSSMLALAQAADSLLDLVLGVLLFWATSVALRPRDEGHPHGHHAAEPIAALVVAVVAGVIAIELTATALERLSSGVVVALTPTLLAIFAGKGALKAVLAIAARRVHRATGGPAAGAIWVDSRNDVLVSLIAVVGYFLVNLGQPAWDAVLSIPTAGWIAWSGFALARDNVALLMGSAATQKRRRQLGRLVAEVPGVESFHDLVARHHGTHLDVTVHVVLDPDLSLRVAHDIGDAVSAALHRQPDVSRVAIHLDVDDDTQTAS